MAETDGRAERVIRHSRALGADMQGLKEELGGAVKDLGQRMDLAGAVQAHPFRAVLVAAGVGYVLGGGLFTPLTGRLLSVGARAVLLPIFTNQLGAMAEGAAGTRH